MEKEFKVGDRVVGVGEFHMKNIDGEKGTVRYVNDKWVKVNYDNDIEGWGNEDLGIANGHGWGCPVANLRRITEDAAPSAWAIHITPSSNATHAVFKQGKRVRDRAVEHCNPRDAYDATTGAAWAFLQLHGMADAARRVLAEMDVADEPAPVPQPTYKPGDRVRIVAERGNGSYIPRNSVYMASWLGKEMTVSKVEDDEIVGIDYYMVEDGGAFVWGPADIAGKVGESRKEK